MRPMTQWVEMSEVNSPQKTLIKAIVVVHNYIQAKQPQKGKMQVTRGIISRKSLLSSRIPRDLDSEDGGYHSQPLNTGFYV